MYLVFDMGGTNIRLAVSPDGQNLSDFKSIPTEQDFSQGLRAIKQTGIELSKGQTITGVAGGIAGPLDKEKTMLVKSPHISGWVNKPLKKELEKIFNCKVELENDTALGGLGEAVFGEGKGSKIIAYIAVGTGVGGARIVDAKIDQNSQGFEPGHQIILPNGSPCQCGGVGHLETLVGGYYLERTYKQKGEDITDENIWNEVCKYLAIGLYNTTVHWSPDIIILGGSVTKSISLDKLQQNLDQLLTIFPKSPKIIKASLDNKAGLFGGLKLLS